ncbi:hypothetical protein FB381_2175 [Nocardioides albertanoniae]|uniref:Uncharacterized protein n=1 Tax=Nocardioides albertanoniae TaxID=1175486 RepID=A0A543A732_9ACTN|nr:hypothetical protein [Nocardioides albertanoniae]TQL68286.1 hypothetical protein FB381_2175 [Nocardioides albertanoniae]
MFTWILIIAGVLLVAGIVWTTFGKSAKQVDHEDVRQGRLGDAAKGDYNGGF